MIRVFRHHIQFGTLIEVGADILMCFLAVLLAVSFQTFPSESALPQISLSGLLLPATAFALLMATLYGALGVYKRHEALSLTSMLGRGLLAILLGSPIAYLMFGALPDGERAQAAIGYTLLYLFGGLVLMRQALYSARKSGIGARRVLIVGAGAEAQNVEADLAKLGGAGFNVVGFFPAGMDQTVVDQSRLVAASADMHALVRDHKVDEVVVAVREQRGGGLPMEALLDCRVKGIPVIDLVGFYERTRGEIPIDHLKSSWLIYGHGFTKNAMRNFIKRSFDLVAAGTLLALAWPVMIVTAIAIRLETPGPVIFRQERTGLGGRGFTCLKFRSMGKDAEKNGVAVWAQTNDVRVTRIGKFIRKTRIDELPQLWNVMRGDMSLVGPRPERPTFVEQLKKEVPYYDIRHSVKPGLTGWAQVRFNYGASIEDSARKLQFDLYYVKNHSLFLDILVLFETIRVVIFREGSR